MASTGGLLLPLLITNGMESVHPSEAKGHCGRFLTRPSTTLLSNSAATVEYERGPEAPTGVTISAEQFSEIPAIGDYIRRSHPASPHRPL